jgi:simple sugar transport system permease protein
MSRLPGWSLEVLRTVLALAVAMAITFIIVIIVSSEPREAFAALLTGPLSSPRTIGVWLDDVVKLTLAGLALSLVFQARLFALGAQGQAYFGGLAAGVVALFVLGDTWLSIPLGLLAAAITGAAYGWIPGIIKARFGANEIVSTLMLNYIALDVFAWLIRTRLSPPGSGLTQSAPFPDAAVYPALIPRTRIDLGILIAIIAVIAVWFYLYRTKRGFELRMTGFNARFAEYTGVNVPRTIVLTMTLSGAIGGILGAVFVQGTAFGNLAIGFEGLITFEGILVAIVARNHPLLVPIAALFYGYLRQGAVLMGLRSDVPTEMIGIIQGVVILLVASSGLYGWLRVSRAGAPPESDPDAPQPPIIGGGPLTEQAIR